MNPTHSGTMFITNLGSQYFLLCEMIPGTERVHALIFQGTTKLVDDEFDTYAKAKKRISTLILDSGATTAWVFPATSCITQ